MHLRSHLRATAGWLFAALSTVLISVLVAEFLVEWARENGYYERPSEKVAAVVSYLSALATSLGFLFSVVFLGGLLVGLWADTLLRKLERGKVAPESKTQAPGLTEQEIQYRRDRVRRWRRVIAEAPGSLGKGMDIKTPLITHPDYLDLESFLDKKVVNLIRLGFYGEHGRSITLFPDAEESLPRKELVLLLLSREITRIEQGLETSISSIIYQS